MSVCTQNIVLNKFISKSHKTSNQTEIKVNPIMMMVVTTYVTSSIIAPQWLIMSGTSHDLRAHDTKACAGHPGGEHLGKGYPEGENKEGSHWV